MTDFERVVELNIFPIKSCQAATVNGQKPQDLFVTEKGFSIYGVEDRGFAVVGAEDLLCVTQRGWNVERQVRHPGDKRLAAVSVNISSVGEIALYDDEVGEFRFLHDQSMYDQNWKTVRALHLGKGVVGHTFSDQADEYFTEILRRKVKLLKVRSGIKMTGSYYRYAASNKTLSADGAPFLLASVASLEESIRLSSDPDNRVGIDRARANIVVDGSVSGAYSEDRASEVTIGEAFHAHVVGACARCPIVNNNQQTGVRDGAFARALGDARLGYKRQTLDMLPDGAPLPKATLHFGQNLNHTTWQEGCSVSVLDKVTFKDSKISNFVPKSAINS